MIKRTLMILFIFLTLFSCRQQSRHVEHQGRPDMHTSQLALDWQGIYTGVLPCTDCEGIKTILKLNDDLTFSLKQQYIGKSNEVFERSGNFRWNDDGNTITIYPDENSALKPVIYSVGEGFLLQHDRKGKRITGNLAQFYRLEKFYTTLTGIGWQLIELYGEAIPGKKHLNSEPYIEFSAEGNVSGNSSCNRFFSTWATGAENKLSFAPVGATKMACPEMETETMFFRAMERTAGFIITDDILVFVSERNAPLAKFRAIQSQQ